MSHTAETISIEEAARRLGVDRSTYRRGIEEGALPGSHVGSRWIIPLAAFEAYLAGGDSQPVDMDALAERIVDVLTRRLMGLQPGEVRPGLRVLGGGRR